MQDFNRKTEAGAVAYFRDCIKNGNVSGALSCFHEHAVYIDRDGKQYRGLEQIQPAIDRICGLKLAIKGGAPLVTLVEDVALWMDHWEMTGSTPDGHPITMTGHTSCILKKDEAGHWLWLVDNPFGAAAIAGPGQ